MQTAKRSKYQLQFLAVLILVVLVSCTLVGTVYAWLKWERTDSSDSGLKIGEVDISIYADGTKLTTNTSSHLNGGNWACANAYHVSGTGTTRNLDLKVRNTGTIDAILRATIRVYYKNNNQVTYLLSDTASTNAVGGVAIAMQTDGWYRNLSANNGIAGGYMFLNDKLEPYILNGETNSSGEIAIISTITLPAGCESHDIYVSVTVDAVSYSGNIYKKIYENSASNVTLQTSNDTLDTQKYSKFTPPSDDFLRNLYPSGTTNLIPVDAFPFGDTLPCDLTTQPKSGWLAWL